MPHFTMTLEVETAEDSHLLEERICDPMTEKSELFHTLGKFPNNITYTTLVKR